MVVRRSSSKKFKRGPKKDKEPKQDNRGDYQEIQKENEELCTYYQKQQLVDKEEWELLMATLRTPLPTTFRLAGHRQEASCMKEQIEARFGKRIPSLKPLPFYQPEGHAWHLDCDRKTLRASGRNAEGELSEEAKAVRELHGWLVAATENGDVSRQEAVSMVPPLLLNVQPGQLVLDLCAAPGSKTAQLVEALESSAETGAKNGLVIANDSDQKRAYLLMHQVKRITSPSLLVTNLDGTLFPSLVFSTENGLTKKQFDRILADVPCSGDGTFRKNAQLWRTWTANQAFGLHPLQVRLLEKAVKLLKLGGRLVYSTCSMNPIENEAVVAYVLSRHDGMKIVDVGEQLSGLKRRPGWTQWKVLGKDIEYEKPEDVPEELRRRFPFSCFPQESYREMGLEHCLRILPHDQNTGGFFVAVLEKKTSEEHNTAIGLPARHEQSPSCDDFRVLDAKDDPVLANIFQFYGIDLQRIIESGLGFLVRSEREPVKAVTVVSDAARELLAATCPSHRSDAKDLYNGSLKIINAGVRAFELYESKGTEQYECPYRILCESIRALRPFVTKRLFTVSAEEMKALLECFDSVKMPHLFEHVIHGGALVETDGKAGKVCIPVWTGKNGVKAFVPKDNRPALLLQLNLQVLF